MKQIILAWCSLVILILSGCGGGAGGSTDGASPGAKVIAAVTVSDGDNQSATVNTELSNPLVAKILDASGQPIAGQVVNFVVTQGGGSVFAAAVTSDANGFARERWTLGPTTGPQKVEVRAIDANGNAVVFASFTATAVAPPSPPPPVPASIAKSVDLTIVQNSLPSARNDLMVTVLDEHGIGVPNAQVQFSPETPSPYVTSATVTTDSNGLADWFRINLHATGQYKIIVSVVGTDLSATFNVTVTPTTHVYDGVYSCNINSDAHTFQVINGQIPFGNSNGLTYNNMVHGSVNESDGTISFTEGTIIRTIYSGNLFFDSQQNVTATGTIAQNVGNTTTPESGTWICTRQ